MPKRFLFLPAAVVVVLAIVGCTRQPPRPVPASARTDTVAAANPGVTSRERWRVPLPSEIVGMPATDAESIYVTTRESVVALRHDSSPQWNAPLPGARVFAPRLDGAELLVAFDDGLAALRRATGEVVWRFDTGPGDDARVNRPTVIDGVVVAMTDAGRVLGLDRGTGALRWESSVATGSGAQIVGRDGLAVVVGVAEWAAFDVATGGRVWSGELSFIGTSSPAIVDGDDGPMAVVASANKLLAVGLRDGNLRWEAKAEQSELAQVPVLDQHGDLLVPDHWGRLTAYRVRDGARLWKVAGADGVAHFGEPVVLADRLVVLPLSEHGPRVASPQRAQTLRPPAPGWGVARSPDGALLVSTWGDAQNYLVAYDLDVGG